MKFRGRYGRKGLDIGYAAVSLSSYNRSGACCTSPDSAVSHVYDIDSVCSVLFMNNHE
jgi:hypothetical protein